MNVQDRLNGGLCPPLGFLKIEFSTKPADILAGCSNNISENIYFVKFY